MKKIRQLFLLFSLLLCAVGARAQSLKPTDFTCTEVTATTATLSWIENNDATSWEICLDDDEDNLILATSNPFTINDLSSERIYTAKVRSIAGDNRSDWSESISFEPTAKIRIGSGTNTNSYLPTYTFYNFSLTEQIYTAEEFGSEAGTVLSIDFYNTAPQLTRKLDIYMVNTDKSSFESTTDWVNVTAADLVFSGDVTFVQNAWTTIAFDYPFIFDGSSNVLLAVDDNTGDYSNSLSFYIIDNAQGQAIRVYNDYINYDPANSSANTGTVMNVKNQIRILVDEIPSCLPPRGLAIETAPTGTSVGLTWTPGSDEQTVWDIEYKKDSDTEFTIIESITEIPYTLTGLTPETTYSVKVRGNCGDEDKSAWSSELSFTTIESCVSPTDLAATPAPTSAIVTWEGATDGYNLRYREIDLTDMAMVTLITDDVWGDGSGYQMLLDADANTFGNEIPESGPLTSSGDASEEVYAAFEYKIPTNADGALSTANMICGNSVTIFIPAGTYDWCITNPTPDDRVWIASSNGNVGGRQDDYVFEANKVYEFTVTLGNDEYGNDRTDVTITDVVGSGISDATAWTTEDNVISPYEITDLAPISLYEVQVQGDCGEEQSKWVSKYFVTLTDCPVPSEITIDTETTTANVTWEGSNDSYNLRYRTAGSGLVFEEDWDGNIGSWSVYNLNSNSGIYTRSGVDESNSFAFYFTTNPPQYLISPALAGVNDGMTLEFYYKIKSIDYPETFQVGYSSTNTSISSFTFGEEVEAVNTDWLLFSETIPAGTKYFCVKCTSNDQYVLYVDDFIVQSVEVVPPGEWTTIEGIEDTEYELTGLAPDTKYELQVRGVCDETETDWSEMVPFTTLYASLVLLNDDFDEEVKNSDKLTEALGRKVNVTLEGRTFFKDGNWNSLYLPFSVTEEMIADENHPLHGSTIKSLYGGSVTGTHVDITFSSASSIEAGYWYIFKWDVVGEDIVEPVFKNVEIVDAEPYSSASADNGQFTVYGNYDTFPINPSVDGCYTYYLTSNGQMKYSDKYRLLKTFRIFFRFIADNDDAGALEFNLNFDDGSTQTGIVELDGNGSDSRAPEGYYNLQGVKYNGKPIQKGVYINNGRKVVVK